MATIRTPSGSLVRPERRSRPIDQAPRPRASRSRATAQVPEGSPNPRAKQTAGLRTPAPRRAWGTRARSGARAARRRARGTPPSPAEAPTSVTVRSWPCDRDRDPGEACSGPQIDRGEVPGPEVSGTARRLSRMCRSSEVLEVRRADHPAWDGVFGEQGFEGLERAQLCWRELRSGPTLMFHVKHGLSRRLQSLRGA